MSYLYICEQGATIAVKENQFQIKYKNNDLVRCIPIETLEVIEIFGRVQLTSACQEECLKRGITVIFYSLYGKYCGRLSATTHVNVFRQRKQAEIEYNEDFKLELSRKIIDAKIRNQIVILRRYLRNFKNTKTEECVRDIIDEMQSMLSKLALSCSTEEIMGCEGYAAKKYFCGISELIDPDFAFEGRSKRPPKDPFNSMLSLGYSILLNEIYGKIEARGLNPYFGILHKDREKHPALASDLMEEWRAAVVDTTVLSMINGHEIFTEDFYMDYDSPGVFMSKEAMRKYVGKLEHRFRMSQKYLSSMTGETDFRSAMDMQVNQFIKAIESQDVSYYTPLLIR